MLQFYNLDDGRSPKEQFYILQRTIVRNLQIWLHNFTSSNGKIMVLEEMASLYKEVKVTS
jgi:hypothetical protein